MNSTIPFVDLVTPHLELEEELVGVFRDAVRNARFIGGKAVEGFERSFAEYCGVEHCIGAGSGTDALRFALIASGISPGDTVITVPNTFIATAEAISQALARPEFVDIDPRTHNMDPEKLLEYVETRCRMDFKSGRPVNRLTGSPVSAIVPVHLYGQTADMDAITEIAERYNLMVIEDACQAHGAGYFSKKTGRWSMAGSTGKAAAFSFYPGKNLGACGEGGAITTNDGKLALSASMLRDHGQTKKYHHEMEGYNGRLDAIQAGILSVKLKRLTSWNEERRKRAGYYNRLLSNIDGVKTPFEPDWSRSVYHLYVIRVQERDSLFKYLSDSGVSCGLHYPLPLHLQKAYAQRGYIKGDFPETERASQEILSLPMYPGLSASEQEKVVELIRAFFDGRRASQKPA